MAEEDAETTMTTTLPFPEEDEEAILEDLFSSLEVSAEVAAASVEVLVAEDSAALAAADSAAALAAAGSPRARARAAQAATEARWWEAGILVISVKSGDRPT